MGLSEDPRDGRARAEPGKAVRIPQAAGWSWRWHAPIMPDSFAASTAFPAAPRAGSRTLHPLFSPTRLHEDPEKKPVERAEEDLREGKRPSTAAGEFVREEMHHIREGKHGARSTKQAIAIGLSKARRAGVPLKLPGEGQTS